MSPLEIETGVFLIAFGGEADVVKLDFVDAGWACLARAMS